MRYVSASGRHNIYRYVPFLTSFFMISTRKFRTSSKLERIALAAVLALTFSSIQPAHAQYSDPDPFGNSEDADEPIGADQVVVPIERGGEPAAANALAAPPPVSQTMTAPAVENLFGSGATNVPKPYEGMPKPNSAWSDLSRMNGERIEDTYEIKIREELNKPLPKKNPFGDRIGEIRGQFKSKDGNGIDFSAPRNSKGSRLKLQ